MFPGAAFETAIAINATKAKQYRSSAVGQQAALVSVASYEGDDVGEYHCCPFDTRDAAVVFLVRQRGHRTS